MIKVVEVSSDSNIGGAGKCILTLLKNIDRTEFQLFLVIPKGSLLKKEAEKYDVTIYEVDYLAEKSMSNKAVTVLRRLFRQIKPDIVHTHASMSARLAAKACKIKTVYTRHSVFEPSRLLSKGIGKRINGRVNNRTADKIIAVADAAKDNLTATGVDEKKITVILNGVEPLREYSESEKAKIRKQFKVSDGDKVAVLAARLTEVKGQKYFIEAGKILKDKGLKFKFIIAGTGESENTLKALIKDLELEDTVYTVGFITDMEPLINISDISVNCSFGTEATSLALLEGMSLGKPAVVTDFGGNTGVIQDGVNGIVTPTHNSQATADAIEKLFCDSELYEKMQKKAIAIYNENFTAEVNTRKTEEIYRALLKNNGKDD